MLFLLRGTRRSPTVVYSLLSSARVVGVAGISGETRIGVTERTWYLPVLKTKTKKQPSPLCLGHKYPSTPSCPVKQKGSQSGC